MFGKDPDFEISNTIEKISFQNFGKIHQEQKKKRKKEKRELLQRSKTYDRMNNEELNEGDLESFLLENKHEIKKGNFIEEQLNLNLSKRRIRSMSCHMQDRSGRTKRYFKSPGWFRRKANLISDKILAKISGSKFIQSKVAKLWDYYFELAGTKFAKKTSLLKKNSKKFQKGFGPWTTLWETKEYQIRKSSPFAHFESLRIRPFVAKAGDDLRQEMLALTLIRIIKQVLVKEGVKVYLKDYDIILNNDESGILEFIPNTTSIDYLKKKYQKQPLDFIFKQIFAHKIDEATKNFAESLAGYSFLTYILKMRDRHNGNIMLDSDGHLIHIDFGFFLSNCPGGIDFEGVPFKLTEEYVNILGGINSNKFLFFKVALLHCFIAIRKHLDYICDILQLMSEYSHMECFKYFEMNEFRERFAFSLSDKERENFVEELIGESYNSNRTYLYDGFQKFTNNIDF